MNNSFEQLEQAQMNRVNNHEQLEQLGEPRVSVPIEEPSFDCGIFFPALCC